MAVAIEMPQDIEKQLRADWPGIERHALEGLVVEAYRQKKIGLHLAGLLLGSANRWETTEFLSQRGVYPNYDLEDLEQDRQTLHALESAGKL